MNMPDLRIQSWRGGAVARVSAAIVLLALLFGLVLATTEEARAARAKASELQKPSFVVIQTDDQTLDELYADLTPPAAPPIRRCRTRSQLIAEQGRDLQPLLRLLPALLPLAGQPADRPLRPQPQRPRQRPARTAATPASSLRARLHPQHRHLAAGRRLPDDPHRQVPQRLRRRTLRQRQRPCRRAGAPGTRSSTPTPTTTSTATRSTTTASIEGPFGDSGSWETREYGATRRHRLPVRAAQRPTLLLRDRRLQPHRDRRAGGDLAGTALLPAARLHRAARRLPPPGRARAGAAPLRLASPARRCPHSRSRRLQRGQRQRQAALHPRSALPLADRHPHLPRLLPEGAGVAARRSTTASNRSSTRSARCTGCATPTSSSPPTTASSSASTA